MIREDEKIKRQEEVKLGLCSGGEPERTSDSSLKGQSRRPAAQCCDSTCTSPGRRVWHLGSSTVWEMPHPSPGAINLLAFDGMWGEALRSGIWTLEVSWSCRVWSSLSKSP